VETLEQRIVLSTFSVNTLLDTVDVTPGDGLARDASGNTSLRAAVMEANALAGADTINLPAGTYPLTRVGANENLAASGDLDVSGDLTIVGAGRDTTVISGEQSDRVFHIRGVFRVGGPAVTLSHLTITNGRAPDGTSGDGGGVLNEYSTLTLEDAVVRNNRAGNGSFGGSGGGVYTAVGTTTINNSLITQNASGNGTQIGGDGGGIASLTSVTTVRDSVVSDNRSGDGGPGSNLITAGQGGGIQSASAELFTNGFLTVVGTTVSGNAVGTTTRGEGGGIFTHDERFVLERSVVSNNSAWRAGGVEIDGARSARVLNSTISGNTATGGGAGGIYHTTSFDQLTAGTVIANTTVSGNQAPASGSFDGGGGMINFGEIDSIINSTFSGNTTNSVGGGIANYDDIGHIVNVTIANNTAGDGGGLFHASFGNVIGELANSILADNTAAGANARDFRRLGQVTVASHNVVEHSVGHGLANGVNGNIVGVDPKLGPLAGNGGPTRTHALLSGSVAIDAGDTSLLPPDTYDLDGDGDTGEALPVDQTGKPRVSGSAVDIGAYEVSPVAQVQLLGVFARGSGWSQSYKQYLADRGLGDATRGYRIQNNDTLPWVNADQLIFWYDRDVPQIPLAATYVLDGVRADYPAQLTFLDARSILLTFNRTPGDGGDRFHLTDPFFGSPFDLRFNELPGDVDGSGAVLANDFSDVKRRFFRSIANPGEGATAYNARDDVDGSGSILANDFSEVKRRFFNSLPAQQPAVTTSLRPKSATAELLSQ
jgi:hypothetical protein